MTKLQDVVTSTAKPESASMEKIKTLEAYLRSKAEKAIAAEEKRAKNEGKASKGHGIKSGTCKNQF